MNTLTAMALVLVFIAFYCLISLFFTVLIYLVNPRPYALLRKNGKTNHFLIFGLGFAWPSLLAAYFANRDK